jgi:hypothetical protein
MVAVLTGLAGTCVVSVFTAKANLSIGMVIYYITRTFLNGLRSIGAQYAIVFVIAVGIGPLRDGHGLHTIVSRQALAGTGGKHWPTTLKRSRLRADLPDDVCSHPTDRTAIHFLYRIAGISTFISHHWLRGRRRHQLSLNKHQPLEHRAASARCFYIAIVIASMDYLFCPVKRRQPQTQSPLLTGLFSSCSDEQVTAGVADGAEGVADLGTKQRMTAITTIATRAG